MLREHESQADLGSLNTCVGKQNFCSPTQLFDVPLDPPLWIAWSFTSRLLWFTLRVWEN